MSLPEPDLRGDVGDARRSICCNHLFFCNQSVELQTMLFDVELIINNGPLIYVYPSIWESAKWRAQRAYMPYLPYVPTCLM